MGILATSQKKSRRELIVVLKPTTGIIDHTASVIASTAEGADLANILTQRQVQMRPIFGPSGAASSRVLVPAAHVQPDPEAARFHEVIAPDDQLDSLKQEIDKHSSVETSYIKPASSTPSITGEAVATAAVAHTPDYAAHQVYLGPAPAGVDARYAWTLPGGKGEGVTIIDCEWSWNLHHEDLVKHVTGVVAGTPSPGDDHHGTSVIGCIAGNDNGYGVTGIAPNATVGLAAFPLQDDDAGSAALIDQAAARLSAGDILLLEIHRPGPATPTSDDGKRENGDQGYIAIEWWPDDFLAIFRATQRGILVVEAAGNGSQNLDDPIYNKPYADFPQGWKNPFASASPSSGAILVGAGNPPAGTHGHTHDTIGFNEVYVDRARCVYSNYGSRVDCQGWGWEVTTTGGGDLGHNADHNRIYTDVFAGTSSASPIVTGALACVQGVMRARDLALLTPESARALLRSEGSPQQAAPNRGIEQRIGLRPDLRKIIAKAAPPLTS